MLEGIIGKHFEHIRLRLSEISVNTLFAGSDTNSERYPQPSVQFLGEDSWVLKLLNTLTISELNFTVKQLALLRDLVAE